jgi:hypothetical protein
MPPRLSRRTLALALACVLCAGSLLTARGQRAGPPPAAPARATDRILPLDGRQTAIRLVR